MSTMTPRCFALAAVTFATALPSLAGCGHKELWAASPVAEESVQVTPTEISVASGRLNVQTTVFNGTSSLLTVDRDRVTLVLDDGRVLGRAEGTFTQHKVYTVPPGATQRVWVDFREDGFSWRKVGGARVEWNDAFSLDGKPFHMPAMDTTARGRGAAQ